MGFWSSFENLKICLFRTICYMEFWSLSEMLKYVSFRYKRYNIHNHRYHIVTFITKEQIFLHFQSKSKTVSNVWYERALKYVLFRTILYQTIPYTMKSYLKGHVRLHHRSSK